LFLCQTSSSAFLPAWMLRGSSKLGEGASLGAWYPCCVVYGHLRSDQSKPGGPEI